MFKCKDINHHTSDYLDKNLSLWKRMNVRLHLFMCGPCRDFVRQFGLTRSSLQHLSTPAPTDDKIDAAIAKLKAKVKENQ
ncbi:MAG: zf-HC2 domain-containing protein [Gammaproteobacteria bacterium]|nr:zf-HC2 domain-containing protein [Gammaproteobacteria bacterium]